MSFNTFTIAAAIVLAWSSPISFAQDSKGPSLNSPDCIKVPEARAELPSDEVLGVGRNGEYCAYPIRMMAYHRIVNDHLGGPPILVAYDPDAAMGQVFDPVIDKKEYNFDSAGLKGGLPILKDRETGSIWSLATGAAIDGPLQGKTLERIPSWIITWKRFSELHPDAYVLKEDSKQSAHYISRYAAPTCPIPPSVSVAIPPDKRAGPDVLVFGVQTHGGFLAIPEARLAQGKGIIVLGSEIVLYDDGGKAAGAYSSLIDRRVRKFRVRDTSGARQFFDIETKSTWNIEGVAVDGPLKGKTLKSLPSCRARWFAWSAAFPKTSLIRP